MHMLTHYAEAKANMSKVQKHRCHQPMIHDDGDKGAVLLFQGPLTLALPLIAES